MKTTRNEELVYEFTGLMNKHGPDSHEAKDFMQKYRGYKEFWRTLRTAQRIKLMYDEGEM